MERNGKAGKDVGDERGCPTEGFGDDGAALEKDIVAVVTDNENALNRCVWGLRDGGYHGGEKVKRKRRELCCGEFWSGIMEDEKENNGERF